MSDMNSISWIPVGDLGTVRLGKKLDPVQSVGEWRPYLRVANVLAGHIDYAGAYSMPFTSSEHSIFGLLPGDVLLNEGQSLNLVGRSAVYEGEPREFCFQNTIIRFRPGREVLPGFAQIVFSRWLEEGVFSRIAKQTTTIAHLGTDRFSKLLFPLLPLAVQREAVDLITSVEGEMREVQEAIDKFTQLHAGVANEIENRLVGGEMCRVDQSFEICSGVTLGPDRRPGRKARTYLRVANVQRGRLELSNLAKLEEFPGDELRYVANEGDLLVVEGHANPHEIGRCALVNKDASGNLHQNHLFRLQPLGVVPHFAEFWLNSGPSRSYWLKTAATSSGLYTISRSALSSMPFPDVDIRLQQVITRQVESLSGCVDVHMKQLVKLFKVKWGLVDSFLAHGGSSA